MAKSSEERTNGACSFAKTDAAFCAKLLAAIQFGRESCPVGISREPGTKSPIMATTAFDGALSDLGLADRDDPIVRMVAKRIIELAKKGELDPLLLRDYVVRQFQARSRL